MSETLSVISVAAIGVFAGAMLTEAGVLVPYWRTLTAEAFFAWYASNDQRLLGFFGPVTVVALIASAVAALAAFVAGDPGRWLAMLALTLMVVCAMMFPLYFKAANARFSAADIRAADLPEALAEWASWHRRRTIIALAALLASAVAALL